MIILRARGSLDTRLISQLLIVASNQPGNTAKISRSAKIWNTTFLHFFGTDQRRMTRRFQKYQNRMGSLRIERVRKIYRKGWHGPPDNSCGFIDKFTGIILGNRTGPQKSLLGIWGFRMAFASLDWYKPKFVGWRMPFIALYLYLLQFLMNPPGFCVIFISILMRENLY